MPHRRSVSLHAASSLACAGLLNLSQPALASLYTHVQLQLPPTWVFYDARRLSQDGRAGGYIRISNEVLPIDIGTVWQPSGAFQPQPVGVEYEQATVLGFDRIGRGFGVVRLPLGSFPTPVYWQGGDAVFLPHFGKGGGAITANATMICGETGDPSAAGYIHRVTLWDADGTNPRVVTGLEGFASRCNSVNASGVYVGTVRPISPPFVLGGFVGRDGTAEAMNYPGFAITRATDINDTEWIVGTYSPSPGQTERGYLARAFDDEIRDLGQIAGFRGVQPQAINNDGAIVGAALGSTFERALYWPPGATQPVDFNTMVNLPGETLVEAMDINNAGQILARGFNGYYIFTPVPEPGAMLGLGAAMLVLTRRGSRRYAAGGESALTPTLSRRERARGSAQGGALAYVAGQGGTSAPPQTNQRVSSYRRKWQRQDKSEKKVRIHGLVRRPARG